MKTRDELIKLMQLIANELASEFEFDEVNIGEDRQKGIWGEEFTYYLERTYGECTKDVTYKSSDKLGRVNFRFRFVTPCISIKTYDDNHHEVFCEVEVDKPFDCELKKHSEDDQWTITQSTLFSPEFGGLEYYNKIKSKLVEYQIIK